MTEDIVFLPIRELASLIRTRQISPVEVAEAFLHRLDTLGPRYNAVVTVTRDRALEQARRAEAEIAAGAYRGLLHGVPYGAKDLLATSGGIPTTWGAAPYRRQVFDHDATVIRRLEEAGAVLAAKLAMVELAGGMGYRNADASFTGPGINPWNASAWAGGSSSGSGSAVAAGLVPFAIGSETWGSILCPSAFCGLSGMRPTYGRVSRYGAMALSWTLDKLGPMGLTADDCGIVLQAIAGRDPNDASTSQRTFRYNEEIVGGKRLKLGVFSGALESAQEAVSQNFGNALRELGAVADIEEVSLPDYPYAEMVSTILNAEASAAFDDFLAEGLSHELRGVGCKYNGFARTAVLAKDYLKALRLREVLGREIDALLAPYDAVVAPSVISVANDVDKVWDRDEDEFGPDFTGAIGNGLGLPSISVPNGFDERGLPTGIQFMGRAYRENSALTAANVFQSITDWHKHHPDVSPA